MSLPVSPNSGPLEPDYPNPDRPLFYLKTLYELTAELSPITDSKRLLNTFLLMVMGVIGSASGIILVVDRNNHTVLQSVRGAGLVDNWSIDQAEKFLYTGFTAAENRQLTPMSVTFIRDPATVFPNAEIGMDVHTALLFMVDDTLLGLIHLGAPLDTGALTTESRELLSGMSAGFMVFLKNVRAFETVQALNADLNRINDDLRQTIDDLTEARNQIRLLEFARIRLKQLVQKEVSRVGRFRMIDAVLILIITTTLSILFNFSNPNGMPLLPETVFRTPAPQIDIQTLHQRLTRKDVILVDARPQELFDQGHLSDAINVPAPLFDIIYAMKLGPILEPDSTIVVYGRTISRRYDEEVAWSLLQRHEKVLILTDGWNKKGDRPAS
ncbi:MAG: rhodanese-like domain-containing protein [Desulfatirhabdiaceae bacterium]